MRLPITPTMHKVPLLTAGLLVFSLILAGCGGGSSGTVSTGPTPTATTAATPTTAATATPSGPQASVKMTGSGYSGFAFTPAMLTIKVGTTVVWTNATGTPHTSTSDAGSAVAWDSSFINPSKTFSLAFTQTGSFHYHCNVHPYMHGTISVIA